MELIEGSETSAFSIVTPGNNPKNILNTEHGESLKSRISNKFFNILRPSISGALALGALLRLCRKLRSGCHVQSSTEVD